MKKFVSTLLIAVFAITAAFSAYGGDEWSPGRSSVAAVRPSGRFSQRQLVRS